MSSIESAESPVRSYWRVTLGKGGAKAGECIAGGFVGVDYDWVDDLTGEFPDDWRKFNEAYVPKLLALDASRTKRSAGLAAAQLWNVGRGMAVGDVVLAPDGTGMYQVGVVAGDYRFDPNSELRHQRPVAWESGISRDALSTSLKHSLGSLLSVIRIPVEYVSEIEALRAGKTPLIEITGAGESVEDPLAFAMEMHLEAFLVANWAQTPLGKDFTVLEIDGESVGKQFQTDTGPIDILALSKDGSKYAVIELKRGRASDSVVGQTLRYMGYVREVLAEGDQDVVGIIIALEDDPKLKRALSEVSNISFYRYRVDFSLEAAGA